MPPGPGPIPGQLLRGGELAVHAAGEPSEAGKLEAGRQQQRILLRLSSRRGGWPSWRGVLARCQQQNRSQPGFWRGIWSPPQQHQVPFDCWQLSANFPSGYFSHVTLWSAFMLVFFFVRLTGTPSVSPRLFQCCNFAQFPGNGSSCPCPKYSRVLCSTAGLAEQRRLPILTSISASIPKGPYRRQIYQNLTLVTSSPNSTALSIGNLFPTPYQE